MIIVNVYLFPYIVLTIHDSFLVLYNAAMFMYQTHICCIYFHYNYRQATLQFVCDYALIHYDNLCMTVCHVHVDLIFFYCEFLHGKSLLRTQNQFI